MKKKWKAGALIRAVEAPAPKSKQSIIEGKFLAIQTKLQEGASIPRAFKQIPGKKKGYRHCGSVASARYGPGLVPEDVEKVFLLSSSHAQFAMETSTRGDLK